MYLSYDEFCNILDKKILTGDDFYLSLLTTVIESPSRYCGLFRLSNAKSKLIQNVSQSKEIKFGDLIEDLVTEYIARLGYTNLSKNLEKCSSNDALCIDQFFTDGDILHISEMKIRDDHDSTKKRGQYINFKNKIEVVKNAYPNNIINASMWFVDDSFKKNKNYYLDMIKKENISNCKIDLYYGEEFFNSLKNGKEAWNELIEILKRYKIENSMNDVNIPDFGNSKEMLNALVSLPQGSWNKLISNKDTYIFLRNELFSSGNNISEAAIIRKGNKK